MPEIAGAVESLEIFRHPRLSGAVWEFHIHWTATNGGNGCTIKAFARDQLKYSISSTLARIGLSEQSLTGNPGDSLDIKCIINLMRESALLASGKNLELGMPTVTALMSLPGNRAIIPIPIIDDEPDHLLRSFNGRVLEREEDDE